MVKPIEIEVTETIDFSECFNTLAKKERDTLERLRNTDSIKEYDKLLVQKKDLDEKLMQFLNFVNTMRRTLNSNLKNN